MFAVALSLLLISCQDGVKTPPGMVEVPANTVQIGSDRKDVEKLIQSDADSANQLGGMTPRSKQKVERFFISPSEVTNEMYLRFVQSTGHQPPASWAQVDRELRLALIAEFQKNDAAATFDDKFPEWWDLNWQNDEWLETARDGSEKRHALAWEMPAGEALFPVTMVTWYDAVAYCKWAGLRLPTEAEWTLAARGETDNAWPFGASFDKGLVAFNDTKPTQLKFKMLPINAFPGNASPYGCVDMAGNVWEWTASGYEALNGYKTFQVKMKGGDKVQVLPNFDPANPVIKGGSYAQPDWGTQIDVRIGIFKIARSPMVGFRVAASPTAGLDALRYATPDMEPKLFGGGSMERLIDHERPLGMQRRKYADLDAIAANRSPAPKPLPTTQPPAGYAVFDGFDSITIAPAAAAEYASLDKLEKAVREDGPVPIGILNTTVPMQTPNLLPGTYMIGFLGELKLEEIVQMGASLPADLAEDFGDSIKVEPVAGDGSEGQRVDLSGLELRPRRQYLVFVDADYKAHGAVETRNNVKPSLKRAKSVEQGLRLNLDTEMLDYTLATSDGKSKAWQFSFAIAPFGPQGSLVQRGYWEGTYEIVEPQPE